MKQKAFLLVLVHFLIFKSHAQTHMGEKIPDPQTLEIVGYFRVDSMKVNPVTNQLVVIDSATKKFAVMSTDLFRSNLQTVYYVEKDRKDSTNSLTPVIDTSIILVPGMYIISASCEGYNDGYLWGMNVEFTDGTTPLNSASISVGGDHFGSWSMIKKVVVSTQTTFSLSWNCIFPSTSSTSYIRNVRISATKIN